MVVAPSGGIPNNSPITQNQRSYAESIMNQLERTQNIKEKVRTTNLTRFNNLSTSSGHKGEDLIQPIMLQELQSEPKI